MAYRPPHPRQARQAAGLTWVALAEAVPCSVRTVARAEQTGRYPRAAIIRAAYLKALGLPAEPAKPTKRREPQAVPA